MASPRLEQVKSDLDRLIADAEFEGDGAVGQQQQFDVAVGNFLAGGTDLVDQATPHLRSYYQAVASLLAAHDIQDVEFPDIPPSADIWDHVSIALPPVVSPGGVPRAPGSCYISFEGNVSWEPEHGLQIVFEDGIRVCKVGPYDGHVTNARAYADERLLGVVFKPF